MCSLDFFLKPKEEESVTFFDLGDFRGLACKGSSQERAETVTFLLGIFGAGTFLSLLLIYVTRKALREGHALARRCDLLQRAITEHDEFCAKRGIRGRAETFIPSAIEGFFLDSCTLAAWLSVNNLESDIESVEMHDYEDLMPTAEELIEIDAMRKAFGRLIHELKATGKLPDMDLIEDVDFEDAPPVSEHLPEGGGAESAADAAADAAKTPHRLITAATPLVSRRAGAAAAAAGVKSVVEKTARSALPSDHAAKALADTEKLLRKV